MDCKGVEGRWEGAERLVPFPLNLRKIPTPRDRLLTVTVYPQLGQHTSVQSLVSGQDWHAPRSSG